METSKQTSSSCSRFPPLVSTRTKHSAPSTSSSLKARPWPCLTASSYAVLSINSNAERISESWRLTIWYSGMTLLKEGKARMTLFEAWGDGGVRIDTPVMTPRVPSAPMKSCLRSYPDERQAGDQAQKRKTVMPVLSLRRVDSWSSIVPSGSTTSRPRTVPWREPYRSRRRPPALVDTFPPI